MQKKNFLNRDRNKTYFPALPLETILCECVMFFENSFVGPVCTLKLQGIDHNYLKKLL